jgi:hypothetical protein
MTRLLALLLALGCASTAPPLLTVVPTPEGPVAVYAPDYLTADQQAAIFGEVVEGYRDGRAMYSTPLPPTSSFTVRVKRSLGPHVAGLYYVDSAVILCDTIGGFCAALDDELSLRHFCHWARRHGEAC